MPYQHVPIPSKKPAPPKTSTAIEIYILPLDFDSMTVVPAGVVVVVTVVGIVKRFRFPKNDNRDNGSSAFFGAHPEGTNIIGWRNKVTVTNEIRPFNVKHPGVIYSCANEQ